MPYCTKTNSPLVLPSLSSHDNTLSIRLPWLGENYFAFVKELRFPPVWYRTRERENRSEIIHELTPVMQSNTRVCHEFYVCSSVLEDQYSPGRSVLPHGWRHRVCSCLPFVVTFFLSFCWRNLVPNIWCVNIYFPLCSHLLTYIYIFHYKCHISHSQKWVSLLFYCIFAA